MQVVKLVSHISFLLLMLMFPPASAQPLDGLAKPNCSDHCGNISIPYPFGIGKGCYLEKSFDVECDETSNPPRAFLRIIKIELVNITVVKDPMIFVESLAESVAESLGRQDKVFGPTLGALGVLILLDGAWLMYKLIKRKKCTQLKKKFFKRNGGLLLQQQLSSSDGSVQKTKVFSSNELEKATNFFNENRILGHGGQGTVYKGMLADGSIVAVKKSTIVDEDKLEEFINEIVILSQISHRNVVRLLGCCLETEVPLLVYEFIPNGTLSQYLHEQNDDFTLSWESRLRIASEAAGAISYLHSTASIPIYHRDIKSTNILLDEKYRAKVSDFGTSRSVSIDQTHLTTKVQGTFGYLDPEYFRTSQLTEKSDVYSFGVVLVELLSGKKSIFLTHSLETMSLVNHFIDLMEDGRLFDIIDAQVKGDCIEEEAIVIANLAKRCLHLNGRNRPTMREVAMELEGILLSRNGINIQQILEVDNSSRSISCCSFEIVIDLPLDCKPSTSSETW